MKMKNKDFEILKTAIIQFLSKDENKGLYEEYVQKNYTDIRFMWDMFWNVSQSPIIFNLNLFSYLNDSHIETALKKILKKFMNVDDPVAIFDNEVYTLSELVLSATKRAKYNLELSLKYYTEGVESEGDRLKSNVSHMIGDIAYATKENDPYFLETYRDW